MTRAGRQAPGSPAPAAAPALREHGAPDLATRPDSGLGFEEDSDFATCRRLLVDAGYEQATIKERLGVESLEEARALDEAAFLARTAAGTPLDTLLRVLLRSLVVERAVFDAAVRPMDGDAWARAGLVACEAGGVRALATIRPLAGGWFASDLPLKQGTVPAADYVMGAAGSSITLANITVRRPAAVAMDLGTGCGVQAVLAAAHCERVIATDVNPRALAFAAFNARLNGRTNVETRAGSLYEPVPETTFDLIVSNPPFVISPSRAFVYRDGGMHGDSISEAVLRGAATRLNPGGFACVLCNWAHVAGRDWRERLASWASDTGCDLWVLRSGDSDPTEYATRWLTHSENLAGEALRARHRDWTDYYRAAGIEAIGAGAVLLRRSGEPGRTGWVRFTDAPDRMLGPSGDQVARMMESWPGADAVNDDDALRRARLRVNPDVRISRETRPARDDEAGEGWTLTGARVRVSRGLAYEGALDPVTLALLHGITPRVTVADAVSSVAKAMGFDATKATGQALAVVRKWIDLGIVEIVRWG